MRLAKNAVYLSPLFLKNADRKLILKNESCQSMAGVRVAIINDNDIFVLFNKAPLVVWVGYQYMLYRFA